jgi:hypothetical protein
MDTNMQQAVGIIVRLIPDEWHVLIIASGIVVTSIYYRNRLAASLKLSPDLSWPVSMAPLIVFTFYLGYIYGSSGKKSCSYETNKKSREKIRADAQHGSINIYEEGSNYGLLLDMCQKNNQQMLQMAETFCNTSRVFDRFLCDKEKELLQRDCNANSPERTRALLLDHELRQVKTLNQQMETELAALMAKYKALNNSLIIVGAEPHDDQDDNSNSSKEDEDYWDISKLFL